MIYLVLLAVLLLLPALLVRQWAFRFGSLLAIVLAALCFWGPSSLHEFMRQLDFKARDLFFRMRGPLENGRDVVIVDIDHKSLQQVGQWPWPRTELARAVRAIHAGGAAAIGFDIVFPERDRLSLREWVWRLEKLGLPLKLDADLGVSAAAVRGLVTADWVRRIQETDATFSLDTAAPWEQQLDQLLAASGEWDRLVRDSERAYVPPPLHSEWLTRSSRELFFLGGTRSAGWLDEGAQLVFDNDAALGEAIHDCGVVAGGLLAFDSSEGKLGQRGIREESLMESEGLVISSAIEGADAVFPGLRRAYGQVTNVPAIHSRTRFQGAFNLIPDASGAARHYHLLFQAPEYTSTLVPKAGLDKLPAAERFKPENYETKIISHMRTYPSLALELLRRAKGWDEVQPAVQEQRPGLQLSGSRFLPLDFRSDMEINYLGYGGPWQENAADGPEYYFTYVSMVDVLQGRAPEGVFKDKVVIIGSTDPTLFDLIGSPFRAAFPGLEVHATVVDNILTGRSLRPFVLYERLWSGLVTAIGGVAFAAALAAAGPLLASLLSLGTLAVLPVAAYQLFAGALLTVPLAWVWLSFLAIAMSVVMVNFLVEDQERQFVRQQFAKLVSDDVLKKLREDPEEAGLGGKRAELTVFFSDVAGFTAVSEKLDPKKLVLLLNDYLTPMSDIIMRHQGFIDKYIGDAVMACWGVPYPDPDYALHACRTALEQQEALARLRPKLKQDYGVDISCRMGLATGRAAVALMGSERKQNYTVMGDVVNRGARLEPACKDYGVEILICETTFHKAQQHIEARLIDAIVVKGKSEPVRIYELMGLKGTVSEERLRGARYYEEGLRRHWERDWIPALESIERALLEDPNDEASKQLRQRIIGYFFLPPPDGWQGEFVKTSK